MRLVIFIYFFLQTFSTITDNNFLLICPPIGDSINISTLRCKDIKINLKQEFSNTQEIMGKGGFGKVKKMDFAEFLDIDEANIITSTEFAVKKEKMINEKINTLKKHKQVLQQKSNEIHILNAMNMQKQNDGVPMVHSCRSVVIKDSKSEYDNFVGVVYTIMTLMDFDLSSPQFFTMIKKMSVLKKIMAFKEIHSIVNRLWDIGYLHADIKPKNVMVKNGKFFLIDFNLSLKKNAKKKNAGTLNYLSPGMAKAEGIVEERDDLYSLGVTFLTSLCRKCKDYLFKFMIPAEDRTCHLKRELSALSTCRIRIFRNAVRMLSSLGFGEVSLNLVDHTMDKINFTGLILHLLIYEGHSYTHLEVSQILNRIIGELKNSPGTVLVENKNKKGNFMDNLLIDENQVESNRKKKSDKENENKNGNQNKNENEEKEDEGFEKEEESQNVVLNKLDQNISEEEMRKLVDKLIMYTTFVKKQKLESSFSSFDEKSALSVETLNEESQLSKNPKIVWLKEDEKENDNDKNIFEQIYDFFTFCGAARKKTGDAKFVANKDKLVVFRKLKMIEKSVFKNDKKVGIEDSKNWPKKEQKKEGNVDLTNRVFEKYVLI